MCISCSTSQVQPHVTNLVNAQWQSCKERSMFFFVVFFLRKKIIEMAGRHIRSILASYLEVCHEEKKKSFKMD